MGLADDIRSEVANIFASRWAIRTGRKVPADNEVALSNDAVQVDATILYADMVDSSGLVESKKPEFAAEVYKAYLVTACRVVRHNGGEITAFDGDRVMAVFVGAAAETTAAKTALQINHAIKELVNPTLRAKYAGVAYQIVHVVGVDSGPILVAKTGIRGSNDLVWVGSCANVAAKLCGLRESNFASWVTDRVYAKLSTEARMAGNESMWEARTWNNKRVYCSRYTWRIA